MIPDALAPLLKYRQFVTYKPQPSARPGKTDKIPTDYRTGLPCNAQDPQFWTDYDTAFAVSRGHVGFVLTEQDPFWCLDIDECLLPTGWSPLALELVGMLPGAAVEVSLSGRGLHVFGVGTIPRHACKGPVGSGLELYHTGRFVALGHPNATGNAMSDCSVGLALIVAKYFPRDTETAPVEWTTTRQGGNGPDDDEELLRRALASKSAAGVFGAKATFAQLWDADAEALARAYPDSSGTGKHYDASIADAALAQHLAFWTGKNCERIKTLMRRSRLTRDKWEREDYLTRTILHAVSRQKDVITDKAPAISASPVTVAREVEGETFLHPEAQKILFANCCYVADRNSIIMPGGHMYKPEVFDSMVGGYTFSMDFTNQRTTRSAFEAFTKSQVLRHPKANSGCFRPDKPPGHVWMQGSETLVNTYWPIKVPTQRGNPAPFLDHLARILPDRMDQHILLAYMAAVVQHRGVKFQWAPLLQGAPGNGKTLFSRCLIEAIGARHCHTPQAQEIGDKFNDWLDGKIFIAVEDVYVPGAKRELMEILKPMITSDWLEVQGKGKDKAARFICANFMFNSNHKDAIRKTEDDRRFAVFYCKQQSKKDIERDGMGGEYFPNLYAWLKNGGYAVVTDFLQHYAIPAELNPAGDCHRAPKTSSHAEAIREGLGSLEQEIEAAILEGRVGFRKGWISMHWLDMLLRDLGFGWKLPRNKRGHILREMGYEPHPGLFLGQVHNAVAPDGCKPRLFISANHPSAELKGAAVARAYEDDQREPAPSIHLQAAG